MTKWVCVRNDELQHWGIKGMKWGVRRYQNSDGSLTPAGVKRYRQESDRFERELAGEPKKSTSVNDYKRALDKADIASKSVDSIRKIKSDMDYVKNPTVEKRIRKNATKMSDYELQKSVQRMNMEDNYTRMMMNREQLERGENFVNKALDVSTIALRGTTTALTIALLVKQLKG